MRKVLSVHHRRPVGSRHRQCADRMKPEALSTDVRNVVRQVRPGEQLMGRIFDVISARSAGITGTHGWV